MSQLFVDDVVNKEGTGSVGFSKGINVSASSTITGNLNVSGVLTYEDVTNIDAVGVVTARSGIKIGAAGIGGTIAANGNTTLAGIVTCDRVRAQGGVELGVAAVGGTITAAGNAILAGIVTCDRVTAQGGVEFGVAGVGGTITQVGNAIISGITTVGTALSLGDNVRAKFGTGGDLSIYHNGSNSFIDDQGTGALQVLSNEFYVANAANTQTMLRGDEGAGVKLYFAGSEKIKTHNTGVRVTGIATVTSDVNVGSAVTVYASAGIVSATAYYGDGSNLSGAGGMWALMASADIASYGSNEYDLYTDFASHTDKKWWKLVFRIEAPSGDNDFSGCGLRVKTSGTWRSSDYDFQQFYVESTNENGSRKNNQSRFSFTDRDEKWHSGEILFYNPHGTDFYKVLSYSGYAANYQWEATSDSPNITRAVGGYVGDQGAFEGIRLWKNSGSFGPIHFGLFAGNGW